MLTLPKDFAGTCPGQFRSVYRIEPLPPKNYTVWPFQRWIKLVLTCLFAALCQGLPAATYFVAKTGSDSNPGTSALPFLTVQKGVNTALAGDTVLVGPGTYSENVTSTRSGSSGNPIVLNGQGVATVWSFLNSHQYIHFNNFTIAGKASGWWFFMGKGAHNTVLSNNVFDGDYNTNMASLLRWDNPYPGELPWGTNCASGCLVISNTFKEVSGVAAMLVFGDTNRIYGNTLINGDNVDWFNVWGRSNIVAANLCSNIFVSGLDPDNHPDIFQSFGMSGQGGKGIIFESNTVVAAHGGVQIGMVEAEDNVDISDYTFRNNLFVGVGSGFSADAHNVVWYNNTFVNCGTNVNIPHGINGSHILTFTTVTNDSYKTNFYVNSSFGGRVFNNVFLNCGGTNMDRGWYRFETWLTNVQADYNFVSKNGYQPVDQDGLERSVGDPGGWGRQVWWEDHGINGGNPKFVSEVGANCRPLVDSPLVGRAKNLNVIFTSDMAGTARGASWDIGAYEYNGGTGTAPSISIQPAGTSIYPGQNVTFTVAATGTAPLTYQWKLNGTAIAGATASSYTTNLVTLAANGGVYTVGVTNAYGGVVSDNATLTVTEITGDAPSITVQPVNTTIYPGQSMVLTVAAAGTAPLSYQWKLNGIAIAGATESSYTNNLVTLAANGGVYTVGVTNAYGGVVSDNATLTVNYLQPSLWPPVEPRAVRAYSVANTNSITLVWPTNYLRDEIRVARRVYTNNPNYWTAWTSLHTNLSSPSNAGQYADTTITPGITYEYKVSARTLGYTNVGYGNYSIIYPTWAYDYITTGTLVPLKDTRGKVVLLVESGLTNALAAELATLEADLRGDGCKVYRHDVAASEVTAPGWKTSVANTKALIRADYNTDPSAAWSIFIVGHVPIPYAGLSSPGAHTDNYGAHPADWYYADMTEASWTDTTANDSTADWVDSWNVPGDGKFDQSTVPTVPELRVGRIDLRNMPLFGKTEVELLRVYLNRNHAWRHKQFTVRPRGLTLTNGFAWESHSLYSSAFGGGTNTEFKNWLQSSATNSAMSFLFASSQSTGSYTKDNDLGATAAFVTSALYVPFVSMYGSYYGDWDSAMHANDVMLAPLCSTGYVLVNFYRENKIVMDTVCMDDTFGQEALAMSATGVVDFSKRYLQYGWEYGGNWYDSTWPLKNYNSLMGDPTLRIRQVAPPSNLVVATNGDNISLTWTAAADTNVQGYHVYRAPAASLNDFTRLTTTPVASPYTDMNGALGDYRYMVRTVKLEQSANRSYYNASQGIVATTGQPPSPPTGLRVTAP